MVKLFRQEGDDAQSRVSMRSTKSVRSSRSARLKNYLSSRRSSSRKSDQSQKTWPPDERNDSENSSCAQNIEPENREATDSNTEGHNEKPRHEKDIGNAEIMYERFGNDPTEVLMAIQYDKIPMISNDTDVLVKVEASTVSLNDCVIRRGMWHKSVALPATPGFDIVGYIHKRGDKVETEGYFQDGDRVAAIVGTGGNAKYCVVPASRLIKIPKNVDASDAVSILSSYVTAYQALQAARPAETKQSLRGAEVLVTGGIGPVGQAVIQLATRAGANVYATGTVEQHVYLSTLGATCLPIHHDRWLPAVEGKMDVVIDSICEDGYGSPRAALNDEGVLVCVGMSYILYSNGAGLFGLPAAAMWASIKANYLMGQTTSYEVMQSYDKNPEAFKHDFGYLIELLERGQIKPNIAKRIALSRVAEAQQRIEEGKIFGSIVCFPWKGSAVEHSNKATIINIEKAATSQRRLKALGRPPLPRRNKRRG